jgi:NTE family protein
LAMIAHGPMLASMTTAFVLSGGASLGATQAGMLQALYERDIRPDLFVGTSAGALNAAFAASRPSTTDAAIELQRVWLGLTRSQIFPASPLTAALGALGVRDHSFPPSGLRRVIERYCDFACLEDAAVPVHVVAADVLTGKEVLLSEGPVVDALLASSAIPGVFPPVVRNGRLLMDGGVVNNAPIAHAVELGADRVFVLSAMGRSRLEEAPRGALAAGVAAITRAITRRLEEDIARYEDVVDLIVLPAPTLPGLLPTDFGHADELVAQGLHRTRAELRRHHAPARSLRRAA